MSIEIITVIAIAVFALILFTTEYVSFDIIALLVMASLIITGILTPSQGLSGFSNPATITIGAMFVVSEGIRKTGLLEYLTRLFDKLQNLNRTTAMLIMMGIVSVISAFINNTAVVVVFIPIIITTANKMNLSPSKLLMPLSFASMLGGVCSLIGTSTNILVSSIAKKRGIPEFGIFEFAPLGLILLAVGFIYIFIIGLRLIPARRKKEDLTKSYEMEKYLTDIKLTENFVHFGSTVQDILDLWGLDIEVVRVFRGKQVLTVNNERTRIHKNDVFRIAASPAEISKLLRNPGIQIQPAKKWRDIHLEEENFTLIEAVIAPDSSYTNEKLKNINLYDKYGAIVLGIRSRGKIRHNELGQVNLYGGDTLLISLRYDQIDNLKSDRSFVVTTDTDIERYREKKQGFALLILAAIVLTAAFNVLPIVASASAGVVLLVITGCLKSEEIYQAINWKVIFLLAGIIPLGVAMDKTGAAKKLSDFLIHFAGDFGPTVMLSGFFLITMLLTSVISNQATAALFVPIAIKAAMDMGVSPRPFLMAITFAASLSFLTPMGYQTNTLIYGPGHFKFTDYTKVGALLNVILWIIATAMIPVIWPF